MKESLEVKRELSFDDLDKFLWAGARDRWDDATDEQKEMVWDRILEIFAYGDESIPSETEINDLVWFECDDIFFPENDEEEDEEMDESICRRRNIRRVIESRRHRVSENKRRRIARK